ncbi:hypothetical protein BU23DRAFT_17471 [Bimuria novae-zelandiae CBS 107.79]|uniref:Uncharacterized protein n=1 Tax=Bimuria novae-zelandiae CBS 107.79 TaxID=1447943 RepID=A0A6A5UKL4_9PLEO|nr:hypothetical protein BU23DRAFT_17471 [Bimuria novae-zelandiae CBS 107.79]
MTCFGHIRKRLLTGTLTLGPLLTPTTPAQLNSASESRSITRSGCDNWPARGRCFALTPVDPRSCNIAKHAFSSCMCVQLEPTALGLRQELRFNVGTEGCTALVMPCSPCCARAATVLRNSWETCNGLQPPMVRSSYVSLEASNNSSVNVDPKPLISAVNVFTTSCAHSESKKGGRSKDRLPSGRPCDAVQPGCYMDKRRVQRQDGHVCAGLQHEWYETFDGVGFCMTSFRLTPQAVQS